MLPLLCDPKRPSIDVGANWGAYTVLLRRFSERVVAFEANPALARRLALMTALRHGVGVKAVALSNRAGTATLRVPDDHGRSTLHGDNDLGGRAARAVEVPMATLDSFGFRDVGFIKIDVEGHELEVLRGAHALLRACRPTLLVEAAEEHRQDAVASLVEHLAGYGYTAAFLDRHRLRDARDYRVHLHKTHNFIFVHAVNAAVLHRLRGSEPALVPAGWRAG